MPLKIPMDWNVYMIECQDGSIYTGIAKDVAARYAQHAAGKGARYTRSHPPRRLLCTIPAPDQSAALKEEYRIKQLPPERKRQLAQIHASSIVHAVQPRHAHAR